MPILAVPAVYMVSGIAGGLASANLAVDRVTVTSSAAICGLIGLLDTSITTTLITVVTIVTISTTIY